MCPKKKRNFWQFLRKPNERENKYEPGGWKATYRQGKLEERNGTSALAVQVSNRAGTEVRKVTYGASEQANDVTSGPTSSKRYIAPWVDADKI